MNGACADYPLTWSTQRPLPLGRRGQLYVGVATQRLTYPMGVSMAGFFGRGGPSTPYNDSLGGTTGVYDGQEVRVMVLSTDTELVILVRQPLAWSTDIFAP